MNAEPIHRPGTTVLTWAGTDAWRAEFADVQHLGDGFTARGVQLGHDGQGTWTCHAAADGLMPLPAPGGDAAALGGALDCDLELSPLTNTMPILRHRLHRQVGDAVEFSMAWVSVPDLQVRASAQRYQTVQVTDTGAVVRYRSGTFAADLRIDTDGFVTGYPDLAQRVTP